MVGELFDEIAGSPYTLVYTDRQDHHSISQNCSTHSIVL